MCHLTLNSLGVRSSFFDPEEDYLSEERARANQPTQVFRELTYIQDSEVTSEEVL